ncbi:hypothetical protein D3C72_2036660 [compost metagenome]
MGGELLDRPHAHGPMGQDGGGQGRVHMTGDFLIIIADHRHIPGNGETGFLQRLVAADGRAIVLAEDGGRTIGQGQQLHGRTIAGAS